MRIRIDRWASYGHFEAGKTSLTLKNVSFLFKKLPLLILSSSTPQNKMSNNVEDAYNTHTQHTLQGQFLVNLDMPSTNALFAKYCPL